MTPEEDLIIKVREAVEAKHSDANVAGYQHAYDADCPACTVRTRIKSALVAYDKATNYASFKSSENTN